MRIIRRIGMAATVLCGCLALARTGATEDAPAPGDVYLSPAFNVKDPRLARLGVQGVTGNLIPLTEKDVARRVKWPSGSRPRFVDPWPSLFARFAQSTPSASGWMLEVGEGVLSNGLHTGDAVLSVSPDMEESPAADLEERIVKRMDRIGYAELRVRVFSGATSAPGTKKFEGTHEDVRILLVDWRGPPEATPK